MSSLQVIIPAYNAEHYIAYTLDSVLLQSSDEIEIVVIDNASTDETEKVVRAYSNRGVKYYRNPSNIGAIRNHNFALSIATAAYVKLLSADDVLLPGVLTKQMAALDNHPTVGLVTCNCIETDRVLNPIGEIKYLNGFWQGSDAVAFCAKKVANLIGAPSNIMMRRKFLGGATFNVGLKWMGDLDFACQVLANSDFYNIDDFGFLYRRHDATDSLLSCPFSVRLNDEITFSLKYGGGVLAMVRILYRTGRLYIRKLAT